MKSLASYVVENNGMFKTTYKRYFPYKFEKFSINWVNEDPDNRRIATYKGSNQDDSYQYGIQTKGKKREMSWKYFADNMELLTDMDAKTIWSYEK